MPIMLKRMQALLGVAAVVMQPLAAATDVTQIVHDSADALGMVRLVSRNMELLNTVEYTATGTLYEVRKTTPWPQTELKHCTVGISYLIPAMRLDWQSAETAGKTPRQIQVVHENRAWDERGQPGMNPGPASSPAEERLPFLWLTPHGVIRAAVNAIKSDVNAVKVAENNGATVLTIPVSGTQITATLGADKRVVRAEMPFNHRVLGNTVLSANFSGYKDYDLYGVFAPAHITFKLGNKVVLDLAVTEFHSNPYVVFPTPELLARAAQEKSRDR